MDNKEILEKALERAVKNGYEQEQVNAFWRVLNEHEFQYEMRSVLIKSLLFDHDFCRAFFGIQEVWFDGSKIPNYLSELAYMVMEENPLSYIERFLEGK
jgi:hypothetical protein